MFDLQRREAEDPDNPGIPLDTPERHAISQVFEDIGSAQDSPSVFGVRIIYSSRADVLARAPDDPVLLEFWAGEYRRSLALWERLALEAEERGEIANPVWHWAQAARCHNALGDFAEARAAYERGTALATRLTGPSPQTFRLAAARDEMRLAVGEGWEEARSDEALLNQPALENKWTLATTIASGARIQAHLGNRKDALSLFRTLLVPLERAPAWAQNYSRLAGDAASTLWLLDCTDSIEIVEHSLRAKVVRPDFRCPMQDGRLSLARLRALQRDYDEATKWFDRARLVLDEQGARPLRAITDFDEGWMYLRRDAPGDRGRAAPLLDAALRQFRELGMWGWIRRAETLRSRCEGATVEVPAAVAPPLLGSDAEAARDSPGPARAALRCEGDYWTIAYGDVVARVKDLKGLHYLIHLLRHPGREFHALDLIAQGPGGAETDIAATPADRPLPMLDEEAKAAYRRRLGDLRAELAEAERCHDLGREEHAREEIEVLTQQPPRR
jgi:tetratricopeptide (TPR) repeat protein